MPIQAGPAESPFEGARLLAPTLRQREIGDYNGRVTSRTRLQGQSWNHMAGLTRHPPYGILPRHVTAEQVQGLMVCHRRLVSQYDWYLQGHLTSS